MPSVFSPSLRIEEIASGEASGTWGVRTNNNLGNLIEQAITYTTFVDVTSSDVTLTSLNGVVDQARSAVLEVTGTPGVTRVITIPNVQKTYTVINRTGIVVQVKTPTGAAFLCPFLSVSYLVCNGSDGIAGRSITDGANSITSLAAPFTSPAFLGVPTAPTAPVTTNDTQLATTAFVRSILPAGVVLMWSGSIASIPSGWLLCNGASGTPDLRDRFVVGAGTTYAPGATGGANTIALSIANLPAHDHTGTTVSANLDHNHGFSATSGLTDVSHSHTGSGSTSNVNVDHIHSGTTGDPSANHTHSFNVNSGGQSANHSHGASASTADLVGDFWVGGANSGTGGIVSRIATGGRPGLDAGSGFQELYRVNATHSHAISVGANDTGHVHNVAGSTSGVSANHNHAFSTGGMSANAAHEHTYSFTTSVFSGNHSHPVSGTTGSMSANSSHSHTFTTSSVGSGTAVENRPPYYALAYIMKS